MSDKIESYWTLRRGMLSRISDHLSDLQNQSDESQDSFQTGSVEGQSHVHYSRGAMPRILAWYILVGLTQVSYLIIVIMTWPTPQKGVQMKIVSQKRAIILKICFILKIFVDKQMMKVTLISNMKNFYPISLGRGPQKSKWKL